MQAEIKNVLVMKLEPGELPEVVEEDGTADIIETKQRLVKMTLSNKAVLTDRNGVVEIVCPAKGDNCSEENTSKASVMNGNATKSPVVNGNRREPVENELSDTEDNYGAVDTEADDLANTLSSCKISENSEKVTKVQNGRMPDECDDELCGKISNLSLDKSSAENTNVDTSEEGQFIEIAAGDIITKEEAEKKKSEDAADEEARERGPNGGKAVNHIVDNHAYNRAAAKSYPAQFGYCTQLGNNYNGFGQNLNLEYEQRTDMSHYQHYLQQQQKQQQQQQQQQLQARQQQQYFQQHQYPSSKRRTRDDDDEQPLKFTRPVDQQFNDVNNPGCHGNGSVTSKVISKNAWSGGQVSVKTPEIETEPMMPRFGELGTPPVDNMDLLLQNLIDGFSDETLVSDLTQIPGGTVQAQAKSYGENGDDFFSDGYVSDVYSPTSDVQGSPPEQSMLSPANMFESPPSNISQLSDDSGICATVHSPSDASVMDVPSPQSQNGYESSMDCFSPRVAPSPVQTGTVPLPNGTLPVQNNRFDRFDPSVSDPDVSEFINDNIETLRDVLNICADDLKKSKMIQKDKSKNLQSNLKAVSQQPNNPTLPTSSVPPRVIQNKPTVPVTRNVPVASVQPQATMATQLPVSVPATTAPVLLVKSTPSSVPVPISLSQVNSTMSVPQPAANGAPILVFPTAPQPTQTIFVVTQPPALPKKQVTKFREIKPKVGPNPGASCKGQPEVKTQQMTAPLKSVPPVTKTAAVAPQPITMSPAQRVLPSKPAVPAPSQASQLNKARRHVANITTDDLRYSDDDKDTCLHIAVCRTDKFMVQALLERFSREDLKCMIDMQNSERQTALYLAVCANKPEMVEVLINHGADVNVFADRLSQDGHSREVKAAIHCAASNGAEYLTTLQALFKAPDLILNLANSDGYTALHCAILEHSKTKTNGLRNDSRPIVEALIRAGADPNAQDKKSGKTAIMYALETRDLGLIDSIIKLLDQSKFRSYFRTQSFDGTTCVKIVDSMKNYFPSTMYEKLSSLMSHR